MHATRLLFIALVFSVIVSPHASGGDDPVQQKMRSAFERSYVLEKEKRYTEAMNALQTLNQPNEYPVNLRLGWLAHHAGQYAQSVGYYKAAQKLQPKATEPLWGLLLPLNAQENWTEAEKVYLSILALDPKSSSANYHLGLIYYYREDFAQAKKYLDASLELSPFDYYSMLMSAWTRLFLGQTDDAARLFDRVLLNTPGDQSAQEGLARIR
ncbi:MAG: tetratricopeptide repeat protein [Bacteroidota bacterium]|jgi:tetratricopeptide (TPR) repeat protein